MTTSSVVQFPNERAGKKLKPFEQYVNMLYGARAGRPGLNGVLDHRVWGPDEKTAAAAKIWKKVNRVRDFVPIKDGLSDPALTQKFLEGCADMKRGAFIGIATRSQRSIKDLKGGREYCQELPCTFLDVDFKHLGEEEAIRRVNNLSLEPSMVVESGGGLHVYHVLKRPFVLNKEYAEAHRWLRHIASTVAEVVDIKVSEPSRVLRVPGSYNWKPEYGEPRLVTLSLYNDNIYTLDQIQKGFGEPPLESEEASSDEGPFDISKYEHIDTGDRHTLLWNYLRSQKAKGVELEEALKHCHFVNDQKCKPPIARQKLDDYLRRVWKQPDSPEFKNQRLFVRTKDRKIIAKNQSNVLRAAKKLDVTLRRDEFLDKTVVQYRGYSGHYEDPQRNQIWLDIDRKFHFQVPDNYFELVMDNWARQNSYHPVRDYLEGLEWDQEERVDDWLAAYAGATNGPYARAISWLLLGSAVRRIFQPGTKFDEMIVLEGPQGSGKSSLLRVLCDDASWFLDDLPLNCDAKQIIERTTGKWIVEAAELSGMHASRVESLKSMMSRQVDGPTRMAYAHLPLEKARQFVLVGTTNAHAYLDDATGNRRFWPIDTGQVKLKELARDKDQLWAEAVMRHKRGDSIRLDPELYEIARIQQERRRNRDPWEPVIEAEFETDDYQRVTPREIWKLLGIPTDRQDHRMNKRIATIMQRLGFRSGTVHDSDEQKKVRGWKRDGERQGELTDA